jgi:acyl CoA:acetate/3-ketoacid CoA transferase
MKIIPAEQVPKLIRDGATVVTGGFTTTNVPYEILLAIRDSFLKTGSSKRFNDSSTCRAIWRQWCRAGCFRG